MSQESVNIFAISAIPQTNYQTALVASSVTKNYRQVEKKDRQLANFMTRFSDNKGYSTGTAYPNRKEILEHDVEFSTVEDASSQLLGERALAGFGALETTEVEPDEVYQHNFTIINPQDSPQQPAYTYAEKAGESASLTDAHNAKYPSVVAGQQTFRGQGTSKLEIATTWTGSGKQTKPSGINFFSTSHVKLIEDMVQNFFRNSQADLKLYPEKDLGGSAFQVLCAFRDFECSINQDLLKAAGYLGCAKFQDQNDPESGSVRGKCEVGSNQAVTFSFTMLMNDDGDYDPQEKMKTLASISAELKFTGKTITGSHKHYALWKLLAANIIEAQPTTVDGQNAWRITTEPLAQGQILPVELEIVNNVKSYTVAADTW